MTVRRDGTPGAASMRSTHSVGESLVDPLVGIIVSSRQVCWVYVVFMRAARTKIDDTVEQANARPELWLIGHAQCAYAFVQASYVYRTCVPEQHTV